MNDTQFTFIQEFKQFRCGRFNDQSRAIVPHLFELCLRQSSQPTIQAAIEYNVLPCNIRHISCKGPVSNCDNCNTPIFTEGLISLKQVSVESPPGVFPILGGINEDIREVWTSFTFCHEVCRNNFKHEFNNYNEIRFGELR